MESEELKHKTSANASNFKLRFPIFFNQNYQFQKLMIYPNLRTCFTAAYQQQHEICVVRVNIIE